MLITLESKLNHFTYEELNEMIVDSQTPILNYLSTKAKLTGKEKESINRFAMSLANSITCKIKPRHYDKKPRKGGLSQRKDGSWRSTLTVNGKKINIASGKDRDFVESKLKEFLKNFVEPI